MNLVEYNEWCKEQGLRPETYDIHHRGIVAHGFWSALGKVSGIVEYEFGHKFNRQAFLLALGDLLFYLVWLSDIQGVGLRYVQDVYPDIKFNTSSNKVFKNLASTAAQVFNGDLTLTTPFLAIHYLAQEHANADLDEVIRLSVERLAERLERDS